MARDRQKPVESLHRRTYLKLFGAAAATGSVALANTAQAERTLNVSDGDNITQHLQSIGDGENVNIPKGTYKVNSLTIRANNWTVDGQGCTFVPASSKVDFVLTGRDWSFGGIRFDVSENMNIRVLLRGGPWRFHHVAWDGKNANREQLIHPEINNSGTDGIIDSVWLGSGVGHEDVNDTLWNKSAIKGIANIHGRLIIRNTYFYQNGAYIAPTHTGNAQTHTGTHHYENCYSQDCYISFTRIGVPTGGTCTARNCTGVFTSYENVPATDGNGNTSGVGIKRSRGPWIFYGDAIIEDCNLSYPGETAVAASTSSRHAAGNVVVRNSEVVGRLNGGVTTENVGSNPSTEPPEGCVTSPEEAYLGTTSGGGSDGSDDPTTEDPTTENPTTPTELPNTVSITGDSSSSVTNYAFYVSDRIEKSTARSATIDSEDTIENGYVQGAVAGGTDSFEFSGELTDFHVDGAATVYLNDQEVDTSTMGTALPKTIVVDGTSQPKQSSRYTFDVSGQAEKSAESGSVNRYDTVTDGTIEGRVINGKDAFRFSGKITRFHLEGGAAITIRNSGA